MSMDIKTVNEEFSVSAQIDLDDLKLLSERGVRSLICNRPDGEAADQINVTGVAIKSSQGTDVYCLAQSSSVMPSGTAPG